MIVHGDLNLITRFFEEIKFSSPEGILNEWPAPQGNLNLQNTTIGMLSQLSVPYGTILEVFYTPVLALSEGFNFLVLDDGGRLIIDY